MNFLHSFQERYTTKMYDANKKISKENIEDLKEILRLSPSSINSQPWIFSFVSDIDTKKKLAKVSRHNAEKVINCDTVVVFSAIDNIELFESNIQEYLPERAINYFNTYVKVLPEQEIKNWFSKQVYLALGVLLSACASMKIDSTPMEGIDMEGYDEIVTIPNYKTTVAVAIGYRDDEDANQLHFMPKKRLNKDRVIR